MYRRTPFTEISRVSLKAFPVGKNDESFDQKLTLGKANKIPANLGWKNVLLAQFQHQFVSAVYAGIIVCYCVALYEAGNAISVMENELSIDTYMTDTKGLVYSFDAFYAVDVVFMIIYKNIDWPECGHRYKARNSLILTIEAFTLIPVDSVYFSIARNKRESSVALLRLRYVVRIIRIFYDYRIARRLTAEQSMIRDILKVFVGLGVVCITLAVSVQPYLCSFKCSPQNINGTFLYNLYVVSEKITGKGFGKIFYHDVLNEGYALHILSFTGFMSYLVIGYVVSKLICTYISKDKHIYSFLIEYTRIRDELREWKRRNVSIWKLYDECLYNTVQTYYKMIWDKRRWYVTRTFKIDVLPMIMFQDLYLDIFWNAFKHSHLFKDQEVSFLRKVSNYMYNTVYAPGEVIYGRHRGKSRMVYIRTGIVQILSEENAETPIISFSGGTCLGESSLIIDYPSNWSVVCKTYCEVVYLRRKDFIQICLTYPRIYRQLVKTVRQRYRQAKKYRRLAEFQWLKHSVTNPDTITLIWLKKTLHKLIENETNYRENDLSWNDSLTFYPNYLNLLVITEDIELVSDRIFLKKTFPVIFQPQSVFLDGWNIFIGIVVFMLLLLYPWYMLHCHQMSSTTHIVLLSIITFVWCTDIYVQSSTAIRTKDTLYSNVPSIIYYRLTNTGFFLDVLSAVPFSILFSLIDGRLPYKTLLLTESHKLLKAYRLTSIFSKIETLRLTSKVVLKYVKFFMMDFFLFYYTATILYCLICDSDGVCHEKFYRRILELAEEPTAWHLLLCLYTTAALFLGNMTYAAFLQYVNYDNVPIIIILQFVYAFFNIFTVSYISIAETLRESKVHQYKEFVSTVDVVLKGLNVSPVLQRRIKLYLKDHFWIDKGLSVLRPMLYRNSMSNNLYSLMSQVRYGRILHGSPLFAELEDDVIMDAACQLRVTYYPPGEVITYAGEVCKEMHIIEFGFCKIIGSQDRILSPGDSFCVIETCMQIPTFYTIVTLTDCKVLSMTYIDYASLATRYYEFRISVKEALDKSVSRKDIQKIQSTYHAIENVGLYEEAKVPIARSFKCKSIEEEGRYAREFGTYVTFLKYLLLRYTFPTYGKFVFCWEISRMVFAFTTNILITYTYFSDLSAVKYFSLCMDITAWIDLYVRHHICYYNEDGIEVSHPAKTSLHYWKNGLFIDVLACAPIDYIFGTATIKTYLRSNRFLQLHRPFKFIRYINNSNISRANLYDFALYIPIVILAINFLSNIGVYTTCASPIEIDLQNATCIAERWAEEHLKESNISNITKQHISSVLITVMTLAMVSFHRIHPTTMQELWNASVMIITGHMFFVWVTARLISNSFYRKTDLTAYQEAMRHLLTFVSARKVDKNIKNEIIAYYEFMWKKTKGKNLILLLSSFSTAIKEDILYDMFGKNINTSTIFSTAPKSFFKSLLLESKYEVYVHKGIIYKVNDVHSYMYILLRGSVDVLGADYNKLLVLSPGSVFGNLDNCPLSRQTLSMIAKGYVEVLKISSVYFHVVISKYPSVMGHFHRQTCVNVDYIENSDSAMNIKYSTGTIRSKISVQTNRTADTSEQSHHRLRKIKSAASMKSEKADVITPAKRKSRCCPIFFKVFEKGNWSIIFRWAVIFPCCFFSFHLEVYQLSNYDDYFMLIAVLYFFDLLYLIKIYLHFHTTYVSDAGLQVSDLLLIAKRYLHQPFGFYFDLAATIPCEFLSLCLITQPYFWIVWTWLRKNRLIRILYCFHLLKQSQAKLHVNIRAVRVIYIISWLTVLLQTMSVFLLTVSTLNKPQDVEQSKFILFIRSYQIITYAASCAVSTNKQLSFDIFSVLSTIVLMLVCKFFITLFISEVCSIIENAHQDKTRYRIFTLYLKYQTKEEAVSPPLRNQIGEYLNLLWVYHRGVQYPSLLRDAPHYLKEAILNAMYGFHLRRHPLIKHCHTDLIRQMSATFDVLIFFPGNFVTYVGDIDRCMYFIHKGEVDMLVEDTLYSERVVDTLVTGDSFGLDQGLYEHCGHDYSYKVTKKTVIIVLNKDKWFHLLNFFPASKRVLFELRHIYMQK